MNLTLYTQLAPLGFAEWLNKKLNAKINFNEWMTEKDKLPLDSIGRTELNALAFRWLREDKDLNCEMKEMFEDMVLCKIYKGMKYICSTDYFPTHPLAEHEALNKALEIISCSPDKQGEQNKGGENGL